jgi:uncharacterized protein (DUF1015 family)
MTKIIPFRGWRYNPKKINDFSKVVAPPYDVINPEQKQVFYAKSAYNVTHIDLPDEVEKLNRYEAAAKIFEKWKHEEVLTCDAKPSLYLYFQTYSLPDGRRLTRRGFFGKRKLESFSEGGIRPHERTFSGPKEDRLRLMVATQAQLSPIFVLYNDAKHEVDPQLEALASAKPEVHIVEECGDEHRLWHVQDEASIYKLINTIHERPLLIADGHHRYETALNYCQEQRAVLGSAYTGKENFNDVMMYFCSLEDSGLVVLPTHRVLAQQPEGNETIVRNLLEGVAKIKIFSANQLSEALSLMEEEGKHEHVLGWVHDHKVEILIFDPDKLLESDMLNHLHFALRDLDTTLLHDLVLAEFMGISKGAQREYGQIKYIQDPKEVVKLVEEKNTYGFLMNPTKIHQIEAVTDIGEVMPQKSTFFYPKLLTGLVFYDLK